MKPITVSTDDLTNIKRQYTKAIKAGKDGFKAYLVCGQQGEFTVGYAKYLIEFLTEAKNEERKASLSRSTLRP